MQNDGHIPYADCILFRCSSLYSKSLPDGRFFGGALTLQGNSKARGMVKTLYGGTRANRPPVKFVGYRQRKEAAKIQELQDELKRSREV
jgi:hypothetical protein